MGYLRNDSEFRTDELTWWEKERLEAKWREIERDLDVEMTPYLDADGQPNVGAMSDRMLRTLWLNFAVFGDLFDLPFDVAEYRRAIEDELRRRGLIE
jgi:hypothetical protein